MEEWPATREKESGKLLPSLEQDTDNLTEPKDMISRTLKGCSGRRVFYLSRDDLTVTESSPLPCSWGKRYPQIEDIRTDCFSSTCCYYVPGTGNPETNLELRETRQAVRGVYTEDKLLLHPTLPRASRVGR